MYCLAAALWLCVTISRRLTVVIREFVTKRFRKVQRIGRRFMYVLRICRKFRYVLRIGRRFR